jgi:hypothetical protein
MPEETPPKSATIEIRSRWTNKVLYATEAASMREAVEKAITEGAMLDGARLDGAKLEGARLEGACFVGASFVGARLDGARLDGASFVKARLEGASFVRASFVGARLEGARFVGARMNWTSHDLVAELLRRAANMDIEKRSFAGLVLISRDWCWKHFAGLPLFGWAVGVLAPNVQRGDDVPKIFLDAINDQAKAAAELEPAFPPASPPGAD